MNVSFKAKLCFFILFIAVLTNFMASDIFAQRRIYAASSNARVSVNIDSDEREIFELINQERNKKGLGELSWDASLSRLARAYSQKMARENFFSHYDRSGEAVDGRARQMHIKSWSKIGENLFFCQGFGNPNELAVRGWMKSASHRENILDPDYTDSGIGIAESEDGKIYITQIFIER